MTPGSPEQKHGAGADEAPQCYKRLDDVAIFGRFRRHVGSKWRSSSA